MSRSFKDNKIKFLKKEDSFFQKKQSKKLKNKKQQKSWKQDVTKYLNQY